MFFGKRMLEQSVGCIINVRLASDACAVFLRLKLNKSISFSLKFQLILPFLPYGLQSRLCLQQQTKVEQRSCLKIFNAMCVDMYLLNV